MDVIKNGILKQAMIILVGSLLVSSEQLAAFPFQRGTMQQHKWDGKSLAVGACFGAAGVATMGLVWWKWHGRKNIDPVDPSRDSALLVEAQRKRIAELEGVTISQGDTITSLRNRLTAFRWQVSHGGIAELKQQLESAEQRAKKAEERALRAESWGCSANHSRVRNQVHEQWQATKPYCTLQPLK